MPLKRYLFQSLRQKARGILASPPQSHRRARGGDTAQPRTLMAAVQDLPHACSIPSLAVALRSLTAFRSELATAVQPSRLNSLLSMALSIVVLSQSSVTRTPTADTIDQLFSIAQDLLHLNISDVTIWQHFVALCRRPEPSRIIPSDLHDTVTYNGLVSVLLFRLGSRPIGSTSAIAYLRALSKTNTRWQQVVLEASVQHAKLALTRFPAPRYCEARRSTPLAMSSHSPCAVDRTCAVANWSSLERWGPYEKYIVPRLSRMNASDFQSGFSSIFTASVEALAVGTSLLPLFDAYLTLARRYRSPSYELVKSEKATPFVVEREKWTATALRPHCMEICFTIQAEDLPPEALGEATPTVDVVDAIRSRFEMPRSVAALLRKRGHVAVAAGSGSRAASPQRVPVGAQIAVSMPLPNAAPHLYRRVFYFIVSAQHQFLPVSALVSEVMGVPLRVAQLLCSGGRVSVPKPNSSSSGLESLSSMTSLFASLFSPSRDEDDTRLPPGTRMPCGSEDIVSAGTVICVHIDAHLVVSLCHIEEIRGKRSPTPAIKPYTISLVMPALPALADAASASQLAPRDCLAVTVTMLANCLRILHSHPPETLILGIAAFLSYVIVPAVQFSTRNTACNSPPRSDGTRTLRMCHSLAFLVAKELLIAVNTLEASYSAALNSVVDSFLRLCQSAPQLPPSLYDSIANVIVSTHLFALTPNATLGMFTLLRKNVTWSSSNFVTLGRLLVCAIDHVASGRSDALRPRHILAFTSRALRALNSPRRLRDDDRKLRRILPQLAAAFCSWKSLPLQDAAHISQYLCAINQLIAVSVRICRDDEVKSYIPVLLRLSSVQNAPRHQLFLAAVHLFNFFTSSLTSPERSSSSIPVSASVAALVQLLKVIAPLVGGGDRVALLASAYVIKSVFIMACVGRHASAIASMRSFMLVHGEYLQPLRKFATSLSLAASRQDHVSPDEARRVMVSQALHAPIPAVLQRRGEVVSVHAPIPAVLQRRGEVVSVTTAYTKRAVVTPIFTSITSRTVPPPPLNLPANKGLQPQQYPIPQDTSCADEQSLASLPELAKYLHWNAPPPFAFDKSS